MRLIYIEHEFSEISGEIPELHKLLQNDNTKCGKEIDRSEYLTRILTYDDRSQAKQHIRDGVLNMLKTSGYATVKVCKKCLGHIELEIQMEDIHG